MLLFDLKSDHLISSAIRAYLLFSGRGVVLELLCKKGPNAKLKKQEIVEAAKKILKRDIPDSEYRQVKLLSLIVLIQMLFLI